MTAVLVAVLVGVAAVAAGAGFVVGRAGREDPAATTSTTTAAPSSSTTTPSAPASNLPPGQVRNGVRFQDLTVRQGVVERQYLVLSPAEVDDDADLPVVMVFHGLLVDRTAMSAAGDWAGAVAEHRFVAVFPQGILNSWNAGPCCPPAAVLGVDDIGFVDLVMTELRARPDVDADRIFLTGFSNGAIFAYSVACARPEVFRSIAPVAGTNLSGCRPSRPVSLLHLHGDPDLVVPYDGALTPSQLLASADFPPVPESVAAWAQADDCEPEPETTTGGGSEQQIWTGCADDSRVKLITYPGNGHAWPTSPVNAIDEMLDFFGIT